MVIAPTITAYDAHEYREQVENVSQFAKHLHIDLMDGDFAPTKSVAVANVWWPDGIKADIHLMYRRIEEHTETLIAIKPNMVIVHAEVHEKNDIPKFCADLRSAGISTGVALLPDTDIDKVKYLFPHVMQVLIFSGNLGFHGGTADIKLLDKVEKIKAHHRYVEIAWDGGIDDSNILQLKEGGVTVFNVGGHIQQAENPKERFQKLVTLLQS